MWRHKLKDGRTIDVEITSHTLEYNGRKAALVIAQDITERTRAQQALLASEVRYRRLFEASKDGILILNAETGMVVDVNPFMIKMLGFSLEEFVGKEIWELGFLKDLIANRENFLELQQRGYIRYEDMPLETKDGRRIAVEFVSNLYEADHQRVIQCNIRDITERKRAEEAVVESEGKYRQLVARSPDGIFIIDMSGRFLSVNKAMCDSLNYSEEEILSMKMRDIVLEQYRSLYEQRLRAIINGESANVAAIYEVTGKDGVAHSIEVQSVPYYKGKEIVGFQGIARDITERLRTEREVALLAHTLKSVAECVSITDTNDNVLFANNAFLKTYGYREEEVLGKNVNAVRSPNNPPESARAILAATLAGGWSGELLNQTKDGRDFPVSLSTSSVRDEYGHVIALVGVATDITERKRAEEQLRYQADLLANVNDAIVASDAKDRITAWNAAAEDLYGWKAEEVLGRKGIEFLRTEWPSGNAKEMRRTLVKKGRWRGEAAQTCKDGTKIFVEVSSIVLRDVSGKIVGNVSVNRDITERKRSEEAKKILEEQLQQAQKLESIGTLASGIAHDFNNILSIILGYCGLLERHRGDPKKFSESVATISKTTRRGVSLVKQLLLFARRTDALFETVSVNDMIGEIAKLLKETFPKTITVSTTLQQDLPTIVADASQIHQVLLNLLVNARDAMPKRGTLSISTTAVHGDVVSARFPKATARQYVQIEVADTGIGMDEATRQRIFEPFFTTKGPGKGTGLGLAVVFGIVEHHSGFIDVRSTPGGGTSFAIFLPVPENALEDLQEANTGSQEMPGGTETILLVEDEETLRELVKASLVSKGYTVLTAGDGMEGLEIYQSRQEEIAIVLCDVGLPLLSGPDMFTRIREINPEAKVILASGFIDAETKAEMFKAGLNEFIQKPYLNDIVLLKIREVIDTKK
jgi:PAS domain S-box-containing protein